MPKECEGVVPKDLTGGITLAYVLTFMRIQVVTRHIYRTIVFAVLAMMAGAAQAQQAASLPPPQAPINPIRQPAYPAYNTPRIPNYAGQYAQTADQYAYGDNGQQPPQSYYDEYGVEQVANLTYQPQPAPPADGAAAQPAAAGAPCGTSCCPTVCCNDCCEPFWVHRNSVFADWLYLKARNGSDVANAIPQNGIGPSATPFGQVGSNSPTYQPSGFRLGGTYAINRCASIYAAYTYWQGESNGSTFANPPLVVHSLLTLPQTGTAASDGTASLTRDAIRFQFADVDYRRLIRGGTNWYLNYAVGARYANLYQLYQQVQVNGPTHTTVASNVGMDAAGARFGLAGARKAANRGFFLYGNAFADILVGNFRSAYMQTNNLSGVQGFATWQSFRPVPILEFEIGTGWRSPNGLWQFSGGYYFAAWFNTVTSSNFVQAVQNSNYVNVGSTITFDGLVLRAQRNW